MRARYPDIDGYVERDGIKVGYEVFGEGDRTILLLPAWTITHTRFWKAQIPYLARRFRVITFDARGNGRSDQPTDPDAHADAETARDAFAVLDALDAPTATVVGLSRGARYALRMWELAPERVEAMAMIAPAAPLTTPPPWFDTESDAYDGWEQYNRHAWQADWRGWLEFFFRQAFPEPHSTKQIEDAVAWGLETTPEVLIASETCPPFPLEEQRRIAESITCPVMVIHGDEDGIVPHKFGAKLANLAGGRLVTMHGSGHIPLARDPVKVNLLLDEFLRGGTDRAVTWHRGGRRARRALFVSSPIGLGHAQRDVAIARELRQLVPDLEVQWLAQDPVTRVLENEGESIHPASRHLALESKHIETESAEHDLHCFQAYRRMDEILVNNFMVFQEIAAEEHYDLWIGDEAWELDYFLHENPELKRAAFCWLTDFVGWIPMPDGGDHEAFLTRDYNAEMIEHIARYPRLRDRSLFVGSADDIVPDTFGDGLPGIRPWTEEHFEFPGYITGFDPGTFGDRDGLRAELGYAPDEQICIVTVGGSGVGAHLLRRVIDAYPAAKRAVPALRMVVVAGPRIDPASLPQADGLEIRPYVHHLYRHLAACDLAVVQGGLTTAMELTANRRPFIFVPLRHHFEQNVHVRHRLERYGSGRCLPYDEATPDALAALIAQEIGRAVDYRPVETDGAARAAARMAELL